MRRYAALNDYANAIDSENLNNAPSDLIQPELGLVNNLDPALDLQSLDLYPRIL